MKFAIFTVKFSLFSTNNCYFRHGWRRSTGIKSYICTLSNSANSVHYSHRNINDHFAWHRHHIFSNINISSKASIVNRRFRSRTKDLWAIFSLGKRAMSPYHIKLNLLVFNRWWQIVHLCSARIPTWLRRRACSRWHHIVAGDEVYFRSFLSRQVAVNYRAVQRLFHQTLSIPSSFIYPSLVVLTDYFEYLHFLTFRI